MTYKVGVSAGWWKIARDPSLLGLAQKVAGFGATAGCQFIQVDLDTTAEFYEPELAAQMRRAKEKMGLEVGLHGEAGELMALDSAEKRLWEQSHLRLIETVKSSADLGIKYVNLHLSQRPILSFVEAQQRIIGYQFPSVSFDGKSVVELARNLPKTREMVIRHISKYMGGAPSLKKAEYEVGIKYNEIAAKREGKIIEDYKKRGEPLDPVQFEVLKNSIHQQVRQEMNNELQSDEFQFNTWLSMPDEEIEKFMLDAGEYSAYHVVAAYMKEKGDPLWSSIGGGEDTEKLYLNNELAFCAAVAAKYIEGHLKTINDKNKKLLNGMSVLQWLEAKKLQLLLETPEVSEGTEGLLRLFDPVHAYHLIKRINSPYVRLCIDFEHMLSHKINVSDKIKEMPNDSGKYISLFHLGKPIPYFGTAHIPIARASRAQDIIYNWLYQFRQKGFKDGILIFERGSGRSGGAKTPQEVMEDSILAIRQMVKYLEKDVAPKDLPPEFFGITWENPGVFARQSVMVREHAWDPLEGVLSIPEEKHTFLSKVAVEKGKGQEWEKRRYR